VAAEICQAHAGAAAYVHLDITVEADWQAAVARAMSASGGACAGQQRRHHPVTPLAECSLEIFARSWTRTWWARFSV